MPLIAVRDGCRIHVDVLGSGPALALISGLGGSAAFWSTIAPQLAQSFNVILFDHRGVGRSDQPEQIYTIEGMARDLVDILDHLGVERAHLVGHSTGGAIAQIMALDHSRRVDRLVLSGTWARPTAHFKALFELRLHLLEALGVETYTRLTPLIGYLPDWLNANAGMLELPRAQTKQNLGSASVLAARIRMLLAFDRSSELAHIRAPTLIIGARDDMVVASGQSKELSNRIPGAKLAWLNNGHFFPRVDPEGFLQQLRFLSEPSP